MKIYPKIELQDGKVVQLKRGDISRPVEYKISAIDAASKFVDTGAEVLHIVDLDSVAQGGKHNARQICEIIDKVSVPVHVAGGIRTMNTLRWWMDHGASSAVLGTAAVNDPHFVSEACKYYPGQIIVSIDAKADQVVIEGWRKPTAYTPLELAKSLEKAGVASLIYTDIDSAHNLPESSFAMTTQMAAELQIPVVSSGVARSLDDISYLRYLPNISGVIIGRALFDNEIDLASAIKIGHSSVTKAEFI